MLKVFFCLFLLTLNLKAFDLNSLELIDCYDGDTCTFNILDDSFPNYLNPMSVRLQGVDTPEIKGSHKQKSLQAKNFTLDFIRTSKNLELKDCKKDKYFRLNCKIIDRNKDLSVELIKNSLGVEYYGEATTK